MANAFTLFGVIKIDTSGFESKLKKATSDLKTTEKQLDKTEQASRRASAGISRVGQSSSAVSSSVSNFTNYLTALGSGALLATAGYAIKTATSFDSLKRALAAVSGSTEAATAQLARLKEVAKSPGLGFREAIQGSVNLQAAGLSAKTAEDALMAFGNALATVGKGKAELDGVIQALSQIQSKGKVSAEEIMQLAERLPQIRVAMQNAFGTADTEKLQDMGLKSAEFINKIVAEFEKLPKVVGGAQNAFDNFGDAAEQAILPIGEAIVSRLTPALEELSAELQKAQPSWEVAGKKLGERVGDVIGESLTASFSEQAGEDAISAFADGMVEGIRKRLAGANIIDAKGLFDEGFVKAAERISAVMDQLTDYVNKSWARSVILWPLAIAGGLKDIGSMVANATGGIVTIAFNAGKAIGDAIGRGMKDGLLAWVDPLGTAARGLADAAINAAKGQLQIQSPSKVFFAIGKDVARGFIDGIESMKTTVHAGMVKMLDLSGIKLTKKDTAGVSFITAWVNDLVTEAAKTFRQKLDVFFATTEGKATGPGLRKIMTAFADRQDAIVREKQTLEDTIQRWTDLGNVIERVADIDYSGMGRGDQTGGLLSNGLGGGAQPLIDANPFEKFASAIPAIKAQWSDFWATMNERIAYFKSTLPSIKQSIGENLLSSMYAIGDVFANAVANWDGTAKGFFKSLAAGFKQMVGQIIGELVRLMVIKAIMNIIGAVAGGSYTPSAGAGSAAGMLGNGLASGGFVSGSGTGTSDSIPAMLSNGEFVINAQAVKKWGAGFFEGLNSMTAPLALAGGGMVGGGATYNQQQYSSPSITINMPSSGNGGLTRDQVERAVLVALNKTQNRNR